METNEKINLTLTLSTCGEGLVTSLCLKLSFMKKVFLIAGILAFAVVSAQQNEFFDIQKHLQEKSKKERKQKEQSLLLSNRGFRIKNNVEYFSGPNQYTINSNQYTLLPNGNKVYTLPLDHMPCIVPDMHQFNMPWPNQINISPN